MSTDFLDTIISALDKAKTMAEFELNLEEKGVYIPLRETVVYNPCTDPNGSCADCTPTGSGFHAIAIAGLDENGMYRFRRILLPPAP